MSEDPKSPTKYVIIDSSSQKDDNEIDLLELIRTILKAWKTVAAVTIFCLVFAVLYALKVPSVYKAEILLTSAEEQTSNPSSLVSQFGGLANMAGISFPSGDNLDKALAILETRVFLTKFIKAKNLLPIIYNQKLDEPKNFLEITEGNSSILLDQGIEVIRNSIEVEQKTQLISLSVTWEDPKLAAEWSNDLVKQLNEQLRERAITESRKKVGYLEQELAKTTLQDMRAVLYSLLESEKQRAMLANVKEDFALEVLDPAVIPKFSEKPNRKLIVAMGGVCGFFLGIILVFTGLFFKKLKKSYSSKKYLHE